MQVQGIKIKNMTRDQLRDAARLLGVPGRGSLKADALREAVRKAFQSAPLPLTPQARGDNYRRQTGRAITLTPRQSRRAAHKLNHQIRKAGA